MPVRRLVREHPDAVTVVVLSALVAIPLLRAFTTLVRGGPVLFTDYSIMATRAQDLWHGHITLVGQTSNLAAPDGGVIFGLGPAQFWLLGLAGGTSSVWPYLLITTLFCWACFTATIVLVLKITGRTEAIVVTGLVLLVVRSVGSYQLISLWNVWLAIPLLVLASAACVALATGRGWALPILVGSVSGAAQMHLTFVAPGLVLLVVGIAGYLWRPRCASAPDRGEQRTDRAEGLEDAEECEEGAEGLEVVEDGDGGCLAAPPSWTPLAWRSGLVVAVVLWWPLVVNQLVPSSTQGNLARLYRTTRSPKSTTPLQALDYIGRFYLPRLRALRSARPVEAFTYGKGVVPWTSALPMVLVAIVLALTYVAVRPHVTYRRVVVMLFALVASSLASASSDNNPYGLFTDYAFDWVNWASALLLLLPLMAISVRLGRRPGILLRQFQVPAIGLTVAALLVVGWSVDPTDPYRPLYSGFRSVLEEGRAHSSAGRRYFIEGAGTDSGFAASALLFDLNGRGRILTYDVIFSARSLNHEPSGHRCDKVLTIRALSAGEASPPGTVRRLHLQVSPRDGKRLDFAFQVRDDDSATGRC